MTRPDVAALLTYMASTNYPPIETQTPEQARAGFEATVHATDLPGEPVAVQREIRIPTRAGAVTGLVLDPRAERPAGPVVVWFHGGGFVTGGIKTHRGFAAYLAHRLDLPVLLVDYRLAPEAPFPAAVEDAEDAARWVAGNPEELGVGVDGIVLGGDSAGGNLAIVTAMALRERAAGVPVLAHAVVYPATDYSRSYPSQQEFGAGRLLTTEGREWYQSHYRPDVDDLRASPLLGDLAGMPPAVVLTAGEDPVRDEGRAYAAALITAGVPVTFREADGHIHAFVILRKVTPSIQGDLDDAVDALSATVRRALRRSTPGSLT